MRPTHRGFATTPRITPPAQLSNASQAPSSPQPRLAVCTGAAPLRPSLPGLHNIHLPDVGAGLQPGPHICIALGWHSLYLPNVVDVGWTHFFGSTGADECRRNLIVASGERTGKGFLSVNCR